GLIGYSARLVPKGPRLVRQTARVGLAGERSTAWAATLPRARSAGLRGKTAPSATRRGAGRIPPRSVLAPPPRVAAAGPSRCPELAWRRPARRGTPTGREAPSGRQPPLWGRRRLPRRPPPCRSASPPAPPPRTARRTPAQRARHSAPTGSPP